MANFKQKQYTSNIEGKEYLFQHPGVRAVSKINDASKNKFGVLQEERLSEEMLKHVIVSPKLKIDDFEEYDEYSEVINAAYAFITGQDKGEKNDDKQAGSESEG
ncbi:hypothetical protein G7L40_02160 [Paenibacillus polymyxa]|uniref:Uncharacterized protein n=1 Tax=Paenibacillus polymyxa TaxID=1406 RepID=A0A378XU92_PAEPO|nr:MULTISPECIES: hypothetical protein [Paenibacillus]KAF6618260.1 hypothetical protein HFE00_09265 [Paenibacillus sp. EKM101P]KAF6624605.1 hypothetical protein HFE03_03425 [Paenibacillus sp. EKM102P]KAF6635616.1 hypothetical protein HFE01_01605 [Paenibacillus sp. EKM10P]KAF6648674.1 hypothetical protein HFE02_09945 [Paenibacillus sp. EKM11P]MBE7897507.1 hypothetical protein [Paenibacillus polymyxa]